MNSKTLKPIFIIEAPSNISMLHVQAFRKEIDKGEIKNDYHIIFIIGDQNQFKFQCFYDKNIKEKKIEDIQKEIFDKLKIS